MQKYLFFKTTKTIGFLFAILIAFPAVSTANPLRLSLDWSIQNSTLVNETPSQLSQSGVILKNWIPTKAPSTVLAAILAERPDFDPFFGTNLKSLDQEAKRFQAPWWYRAQFWISPDHSKQQVVLHLKGINYSAEVWLNGVKLNDAATMKGMFRTYEINLSRTKIIPGLNTIAIKVAPPQAKDLTANWVDWNPHPVDQNMGLWRDAYLTLHDSIEIHHPWVESKLNSPANDVAELKIHVEVSNESKHAEAGKLRVELAGQRLEQTVSLNAAEKKELIFSLRLSNPKLWWPAQMGKPEIYELIAEFQGVNGASEKVQTHFGVRQVTSELTAAKARLFRINGKAIQIRGGGYASDLFLRFSKEKVKKDLRMVQELNLNTVRLEGMLQPEYFYDLADRLGILVMPGWVCCNAWEQPKDWTSETYGIAKASLLDQLNELRSHPSVFVFLYGSDEAPPAKAEKLYLEAVKESSWPNPTLAAAADRNSKLTGDTGVKMTGPYDYVGPTYWLQDQKEFGGAWGFNTETSPGPAVPPLESLVKFLPQDKLWPLNSDWDFHSGLTEFKDIHLFKSAQDSRYGASKSIEEFARKAQMMAYDNERAMFEAYGKNKYHSATGVVQWMLNNAWPSLIWHLYDYYYREGGSFFGVKKANEPVHVQYSYDDRSVVVVNHTYEKLGKIGVSAKVLNFDLSVQFEKQASLASLDSDSVQKVMTIPSLSNLSTTYFLKLSLQNENGETLSDNFYWLSTKAEIYDWKKTEFTHTPMLQEADLTMLNQLQPTTLEVSVDTQKREMFVKNTGTHLSFFTEVKLKDPQTGLEPEGLLWSDQYFSLLPGESKTVKYDFLDSKANEGKRLKAF